MVLQVHIITHMNANVSSAVPDSYREGAAETAQGTESGMHRMEPRVLPVHRSPQGERHMALTALFLEKAWKVTPRNTEHPGSAASTQPDTFPSAWPAQDTLFQKQIPHAISE